MRLIASPIKVAAKGRDSNPFGVANSPTTFGFAIAHIFTNSAACSDPLHLVIQLGSLRQSLFPLPTSTFHAPSEELRFVPMLKVGLPRLKSLSLHVSQDLSQKALGHPGSTEPKTTLSGGTPP